jgi:hypothetical protein
MTATMIKMSDGFFIPRLDGFDDIQKDMIEVNIELQKSEVDSLSYKELKGIAILERYHQKLKNQIQMDTNMSDIQQAFRKKHKISITLDEYLSEK